MARSGWFRPYGNRDWHSVGCYSSQSYRRPEGYIDREPNDISCHRVAIDVTNNSAALAITHNIAAYLKSKFWSNDLVTDLVTNNCAYDEVSGSVIARDKISQDFNLCLHSSESVVFFLYAEGSFTNKVLSIRNTGGRTISLADVGIEYRINGGSGATTQVSLPEADLAVDDTYTICNRDPTNMLPSFGVSCDLFTFDVLHNGDDVVVLRLGGIIVDIIGNTGSGDPGSGWRVCGGAFTNDHFLKRVASVRSGNLDGLVDSWNGQDSNGSCEWISGTYN